MTTAEILRGLEIVKAQDPRLRQPLRCSMEQEHRERPGGPMVRAPRCNDAAAVVLYGEPRCSRHAEMDLDDAEG